MLIWVTEQARTWYSFYRMCIMVTLRPTWASRAVSPLDLRPLSPGIAKVHGNMVLVSPTVYLDGVVMCENNKLNPDLGLGGL